VKDCHGFGWRVIRRSTTSKAVFKSSWCPYHVWTTCFQNRLLVWRHEPVFFSSSFLSSPRFSWLALSIFRVAPKFVLSLDLDLVLLVSSFCYGSFVKFQFHPPILIFHVLFFYFSSHSFDFWFFSWPFCKKYFVFNFILQSKFMMYFFFNLILILLIFFVLSLKYFSFSISLFHQKNLAAL